jgi:hypothetical protein
VEVRSYARALINSSGLCSNFLAEKAFLPQQNHCG